MWPTEAGSSPKGFGVPGPTHPRSGVSLFPGITCVALE